MDLPAEHSTSQSSRGDLVYAGGRLAVLILFTGLFAAAWNSDGTSSAAVARLERRPVPRQAGRVAHAATELVMVPVSIVRPSRAATLGSSIIVADKPALPFTGTPALLGGTLRTADAAPVASSPRDETSL